MTRPVAPVRSCDVLIAGAGPVGLMLTVQLRRYGVRVVLAEQLDEPTGESRASQLNARTVEILDECGLLADFGPAPCERIGHFGGLPLDVGGVDSPRQRPHQRVLFRRPGPARLGRSGSA